MELTKRCTQCGEDKPAKTPEFHTDRSSADQLTARCAKCRRERQIQSELAVKKVRRILRKHHGDAPETIAEVLAAAHVDHGPKTSDYCRVCGESPDSGSHLPHGHGYVAPWEKWPSVAAFDLTDVGEDVDVDEDEHSRQKLERRAAERARRVASDFDALKPEDFSADSEFDVGVGNSRAKDAGRLSAQASREKRQEFNAHMGEFATAMRDAAVDASRTGASISTIMPAEHAAYIANLAEQERRFGNRRWARSIAIAEAHEQLSREAMIWVADNYFRDKVEPTGYARFPRPETPAKRTVCVLLSDLHFGSELDSLDEPVSYRAIEEARRFEYVLRQVLDYKPQYREQTRLVILLNGDLIEGLLMHDLRSGSPLAEQKAIFWAYAAPFIAYCAQQYPEVLVVCQSGNHGRDKMRHPGRATARKWDGHEFEMYVALQRMCAPLKNVQWQIDFRAVSIVDLHGSTLGLTHADTEIKLGDPDTKSTDNGRILDRINSTRLYGVEFDVWAFGHYHKGRYVARSPRVVWNAALVPPNGYARGAGYIGEACGQFLWESVEGHPVGDVRFIEVGRSQDEDERLGKLIEPFRFSMHGLGVM